MLREPRYNVENSDIAPHLWSKPRNGRWRWKQGIFKTEGIIQKGLTISASSDWQPQNGNVVTGQPISPMLMSTLPQSFLVSLWITTKENLSNRSLTFEPVKDKRGEKIKGEQPVRFQIGRKFTVDGLRIRRPGKRCIQRGQYQRNDGCAQIGGGKSRSN